MIEVVAASTSLYAAALGQIFNNLLHASAYPSSSSIKDEHPKTNRSYSRPARSSQKGLMLELTNKGKDP